MLKKLYSFILLCGTLNACEDFLCSNDKGQPTRYCGSRSIFVPHQITYDPVYENALTRNLFATSQADFLLDIKPFYTQSTNSKKLARYFLIDCKESLLVRENGTGDIGSLWLNLIAPIGASYSSTLSMCPKMSRAGVYVGFLFNTDCFCSKTFVSITSAVVNARNKTNLTESNVTAPGDLPGYINLYEALDNENLKYSKITTKRLSKTGLDDIQVKVGKTLIDNCTRTIDGYLLIGIPTGSGQKGEFLFEPLVGTKNFNIGLGFYGLRNLSEHDDCSLNFLYELKYRYACKARERRTFDLIANGQWSRYMLNTTQALPFVTTELVNHVSFIADVTPGSHLDAWFAFNYRRCNWTLEIGYAFWLRQQEKVCLRSGCNEATLPANIGIAYLPGAVNLVPTSASTATISQSVVEPNLIQPDAVYTNITLADLNLKSGLHPRVTANKVYASVGYLCKKSCYDLMLALNGSYEHANKNGADQFAIWANLDFVV